jgi:hypothetical protein
MNEDGQFVVAWSDRRRGDNTFIDMQQRDVARTTEYNMDLSARQVGIPSG